MKTKALYVLVSNDEDLYLEQAFISISSLKRHNPDMFVVVLMDDKTSKGLIAKRKNILSLIDERNIVEFDPQWNSLKRSRYLKTSARKYVTGDFLFIDTDTIIVSSLAEIDNCSYDLAAVKDAHTSIDKLYVDRTKELADKINFSLSNKITCYNSGVFYVKDNDTTRSFYEQWHNLWVKGSNLGVFQDQPSLNILNQQLHIIGEIDGTWNCQLLRNGLNFFANAKIVHYYNMYTRWKGSFYGNPYYFTDKNLYLKMKSTMQIDSELDNNLLNYASCFSNEVEIISGDNLILVHSRQYRMLAYFYVYFNRLFKFVESVLWRLTRLIH